MQFWSPYMQLGVAGIILAVFGLLIRGTLRLAREFVALREYFEALLSRCTESETYWRALAEQLLNITSRATTVASVATFTPPPPRVLTPDDQAWRQQMEEDMRTLKTRRDEASP